ncbi:MAG: hypothetical protein HY259_04115 [Chloroflexi bacterium]|nr:hypothetical protein [Chloroflexota bacterium]
MYRSPYANAAGAARLLIWKAGEYYRVLFSDVACFDVTPDSIVVYPQAGLSYQLLNTYFLGPAMSFWLEWRGIPTLHASAVVANGHAVAFISQSRGGKSVLAASWVQAGHPLLTDDILAVAHDHGTPIGYPGYPQMRLWADEAQYFLGRSEGLEYVHPAYLKYRVPIGPACFGRFCHTPQPMGCLYLVERSEAGASEIKIAPVAPTLAVVTLARHSFAPHIVEALKLQVQQLEILTRLVQRVPVRRLVYPSGFEQLAAVREAILNDLAELRVVG